MKVLHIDCENSWRGGQNQTKLLIDGLAAHGVASFLAANPESAFLKQHGAAIPHLATPMRSVFGTRRAKDIAWYCDRQGISLLDAQGSKAHGIALAVKRLKPELKLIVHRRVDYAPGRFFLSRRKYLSPQVDRYIAISYAIAEVLKNYGIPAAKISVVRSAATPLAFNFASKAEAKAALAVREGFDPKLCLLGNVSAITPQKDYPTLLRALKQLHAGGEPFLCLIAGDGELFEAMNGMARDLGLSEHVRFLGFRDDVPDILQALDILAMPSRFEGLGTVILDALQAGCCVVATDTGGIPEMIKHQETGLLAPVGEPRAFAEQLRAALLSPDLRQSLNKNGKLLVSTEFAVSKMIEGNLEVYRSVSS